MHKGFSTVLLFLGSSVFMTLAWYAHLKIPQLSAHSSGGAKTLFKAIVFSWGLALFEYCLQVPANRLGFKEFGGPFHLVQLRVIQEVVALIVFVGFLSLAYPDFKWNANHLMALACLIGAVYFAFR